MGEGGGRGVGAAGAAVGQRPPSPGRRSRGGGWAGGEPEQPRAPARGGQPIGAGRRGGGEAVTADVVGPRGVQGDEEDVGRRPGAAAGGRNQQRQGRPSRAEVGLTSPNAGKLG